MHQLVSLYAGSATRRGLISSPVPVRITGETSIVLSSTSLTSELIRRTLAS